LPMAQISPLERQILVERHLISPQHTQNTAFKGVALRGDQAISVMINEEDHFRLQILAPGLNLEAAWQLATRLDDHYDEQVEYAFSQELGYLSACPTNLGTGLRASVMIHLPALTALGQVQRVLADVNRFGLAVRGLYGEGTEAVGNIYQLSNQVTLGLAEEEIINHLENITGQIIDQERRAREHLLTVNKGALEDGIYRSYGILAYARRVSSQEAMEHLSKVRLGIDLELIQGLEPQILQEILVMIRPAHLQRLVGKDMEAEERDYHRATLIREKLKV
ncbi:MAG: protein arginine kinase, partial [Limnochordia bacterium]